MFIILVNIYDETLYHNKAYIWFVSPYVCSHYMLILETFTVSWLAYHRARDKECFLTLPYGSQHSSWFLVIGAYFWYIRLYLQYPLCITLTQWICVLSYHLRNGLLGETLEFLTLVLIRANYLGIIIFTAISGLLDHLQLHQRRPEPFLTSFLWTWPQFPITLPQEFKPQVLLFPYLRKVLNSPIFS